MRVVIPLYKISRTKPIIHARSVRRNDTNEHFDGKTTDRTDRSHLRIGQPSYDQQRSRGNEHRSHTCMVVTPKRTRLKKVPSNIGP